MYHPRALSDNEICVLLERAARDPAARRDLASYLHHSELISTLPHGETGPAMSAKYVDEFRARYRLT